MLRDPPASEPALHITGISGENVEHDSPVFVLGGCEALGMVGIGDAWLQWLDTDRVVMLQDFCHSVYFALHRPHELYQLCARTPAHAM